MTIEKNLNGTELTVTIVGRLDTTTAPDLEASLKESFEGVTKPSLTLPSLSIFHPQDFVSFWHRKR